MSAEWYSYLESAIFSKIKTGLEASYGSEIACSTEEISTMPTEFPTVTIIEDEQQEIGMDLYNDTIAAVREYIIAKVYTQDKSSCKKITRLTVTQLKQKCRFNIQRIIYIQRNADVWEGQVYCNRVIGAGDKDLVKY